MTLIHRANHEVVSMQSEPAVAHIHFRNEDGMQRFIEDNRLRIKLLYERWTVDWQPLLTITARKA